MPFRKLQHICRLGHKRPFENPGCTKESAVQKIIYWGAFIFILLAGLGVLGIQRAIKPLRQEAMHSIDGQA